MEVKGEIVNYMNSIAGGFLMGVGLIVAALVMRLLFHVSWCG